MLELHFQPDIDTLLGFQFAVLSLIIVAKPHNNPNWDLRLDIVGLQIRA